MRNFSQRLRVLAQGPQVRVSLVADAVVVSASFLLFCSIAAFMAWTCDFHLWSCGHMWLRRMFLAWPRAFLRAPPSLGTQTSDR